MVYVGLGNVRVEVLAFNEAQEEFVDDLNVRPRYLQYWLVFFRIESLSLRVHWWRDGTEQVLCEHLHYERVHLLCNDLTVVGDVVEQFVKRQAFDLLRLHVSACIVEIEDDVALIDLLHKQLLPLVWWYLVESRQLFKLALALVRDVKSG